MGCAGCGQHGKWKRLVTRRGDNVDKEREQVWVETWAGNGSEACRVGVWGEEGGELGSGGSGENCRGGAGKQRCWGAGWGSEMGTLPGWEQPCPRDALTWDLHAVGVRGGEHPAPGCRRAGCWWHREQCAETGLMPEHRGAELLLPVALGSSSGQGLGGSGSLGAAVAWAAWHRGGGQALPAVPAAMNQLPAAPQLVCLLCQSDIQPAPSRTALISTSASPCYLVVSHTGIRGWCGWFSSSSPSCDQSEPCSDL